MEKSLDIHAIQKVYKSGSFNFRNVNQNNRDVLPGIEIEIRMVLKIICQTN